MTISLWKLGAPECHLASVVNLANCAATALQGDFTVLYCLCVHIPLCIVYTLGYSHI